MNKRSLNERGMKGECTRADCVCFHCVFLKKSSTQKYLLKSIGLFWVVRRCQWICSNTSSDSIFSSLRFIWMHPILIRHPQRTPRQPGPTKAEFPNREFLFEGLFSIYRRFFRVLLCCCQFSCMGECSGLRRLRFVIPSSTPTMNLLTSGEIMKWSHTQLHEGTWLTDIPQH